MITSKSEIAVWFQHFKSLLQKSYAYKHTTPNRNRKHLSTGFKDLVALVTSPLMAICTIK